MLKAVGIGAVALALAGFSAVQALSNSLADDNPLAALQISSTSAPAYERLARNAFAASLDPVTGVSSDDGTVRGFAAAAAAADLTSTEALAILALTDEDNTQALRLLDAGAVLSRRGRLLQGAQIQRYAAAGEWEPAIETLDQTLRTTPAITDTVLAQFVPLLADPQTVPAFTQVLERAPVWGNDFFRLAAAQPETIGNLYRIRVALGQVDFVSQDVDRNIMQALASAGNSAEAIALYEVVTQGEAGQGWTSEGVITWNALYPPVDWRLWDEDGRYARPNSDGTISIRIERGEGGTLAERQMLFPAELTGFTIEHTLEPATQLDDVTFTLLCDGQAEALAAPFATSPMQIAFTPASTCAFYTVRIAGRAWSNSGEIGGELSPIRLRLD